MFELDGRSQNTKETTMSQSKQNFSIDVEGMKAVCPLGEVVGNKMIDEERIPVISCEGGCFRGEVARVAAHMAANETSRKAESRFSHVKAGAFVERLRVLQRT
jgi:hypothetical protein